MWSHLHMCLAEVRRALLLKWEAGEQRGASVGTGHRAAEWRDALWEGCLPLLWISFGTAEACCYWGVTVTHSRPSDSSLTSPPAQSIWFQQSHYLVDVYTATALLSGLTQVTLSDCGVSEPVVHDAHEASETRRGGRFS